MATSEKKRIQVSLPAKTYDVISELSEKRGIPRSTLVSMAVAEWLERLETQEKADK